ncbi:hypothetical protein DL98DRAFT_576372, partial [Cadophora sp. DSE1049]
MSLAAFNTNTNSQLDEEDQTPCRFSRVINVIQWGSDVCLCRRESFGQAEAPSALEPNTVESALFTPSPTPIYELAPKRRYVYIWQCVSRLPESTASFILHRNLTAPEYSVNVDARESILRSLRVQNAVFLDVRTVRRRRCSYDRLGVGKQCHGIPSALGLPCLGSPMVWLPRWV